MKNNTSNNEQIKKCQDCRYFAQHYVKRLNTFNRIGCGHCLHSNNKRMTAVPCEHWEDIAIKKEERKQSIKNVIRLMCEHLNDIMLMLQDDNTE